MGVALAGAEVTIGSMRRPGASNESILAQGHGSHPGICGPEITKAAVWTAAFEHSVLDAGLL
jgi:hypothetical protein